MCINTFNVQYNTPVLMHNNFKYLILSWAFGDNHSRGVGIIIKVGLNYKVSRFDYGPNGRLLILDLRIANVEYRLINVYMPNNPRERKEFITQLSVFCNTSRNVIYGGTLIL